MWCRFLIYLEFHILIGILQLDLNFLEQFSEILEEIYLKKPKRKRRKKKNKIEEGNVEPILEGNKEEMEIEEPKNVV